MKTLILIQILTLTFGQLNSPFICELAWKTALNSKIGGLLEPYENTFKYWTLRAVEFEFEDYGKAILGYFNLAYNALLENRLEDFAEYVGIMLTLMLKIKFSTDISKANLLNIYGGVDWKSIELLNGDVEQLIEHWIKFKPEDAEDLLYNYISTALSLLEKMPSNSIIRVMNTPMLREFSAASLIAVTAASSFFVARRMREEFGGVKYEGYP